VSKVVLSGVFGGENARLVYSFFVALIVDNIDVATLNSFDGPLNVSLLVDTFSRDRSVGSPGGWLKCQFDFVAR